MTIRIAIADDQELVRSGLRTIVESEPDLKVVGEAANGEDAVALAQNERPDVMLMDVRMPGLGGIEATRAIVADRSSATRVVMLTTFDLDEHLYDALEAGAIGFLLKDIPGEDIVNAIRQAARGSDALLAPAVIRRLIGRFARERAAAKVTVRGLEDLTPREVDVMKLVAQGLTNSEIASRLSLSKATVKTHVGRILMKLDLRDRVQMVVVAYESDLVQSARRSER
ncbi:MAG TPA: response regulator transcription factor [Candidatus Dormibacteraeota bacterium]